MVRLSYFMPLVIGLASVALLGCPVEGGQVTLSVSPEVLDFGSSATERVVTVKNTSGAVMAPLVVTAAAPWATVLDCASTGENCVDNGLFSNIRVRVRVDRSRMMLGMNRGTLTLVSRNAVTQTVDLVAEDPVETDFSASTRNPEVNQAVSFTDESSTKPGNPAIASWLWNFGDGATSTQRNPSHAYAQAGVYTVRLTVSAGSYSETLVREGFITAGGTAPPKAAFDIQPASGFVGDTFTFSDRSTSEAGPIESRSWNFGDGGTATGEVVTHAYNATGAYEVTLTVAGPGGTDTATRSAGVSAKQPPLANFDISPSNPLTGRAVQFTDVSSPGSAAITTWAWDFGDGTTSTERNPSHIYTARGDYEITLTVSSAHGSASRARQVTVLPPPPVADFTADKTAVVTGESVQFTDKSTSERGTIIGWLWDFGDGTASTAQFPTHVYQDAGVYSVQLTVRIQGALNSTGTKRRSNYIRVEEGGGGNVSVLREFVQRPDPFFFSYTVRESVDLPGARVHYLDLKSQGWKPDKVSAGATWQHWLTIIEPDIKRYDTALLFIDGGRTRTSPPSIESDFGLYLLSMAIFSGTVVAHLPNVPAQPITFAEEAGIREGRTEDAIIAYTYDEFMKSFARGEPDTDWPLLFPMAKAAVKAMDVVQEALPSVLSRKAPEAAQVRDFVVSGASKRGWTAWLTAVADDRVRAVMPVVIDVLNMDQQIFHHRRSYGYYSPAIYPYAQEQVFDRFDTPEGLALLELVDPYEYRGALNMPKYIINSTGDQFFLPDSSRFYFDDMPGEKHVNYIPNTDHSLDGTQSVLQENAALDSALAFYMAVVQDVERPEMTWEFAPDGSIVVETQDNPTSMRMWSAAAPQVRDFRKERLDPLGISWRSTPLVQQSPGRWVARPQLVPPTAQVTEVWNAFFVQATFENAAEPVVAVTGGQANLPPLLRPIPTYTETPEFVMTTPVRVIPDTYPAFAGEEFQAFGGTPSDRQFVDVLLLHGTPRRMGQEYGRLRSAELNAFIPRYVNAVVSETNIGFDDLEDAWFELTQGPNPIIDERIIEEIEGIAEGSGLDLQMLQWANVAPILESYAGHAGAFWRPATSLNLERDTVLVNFGQAQNLQRITQLEPLIVVYVPEIGYGFPHATLSYLGLVMSPVGVNLGGIAVAAADNPASPYTLGDAHHLPMLREVLYDTSSLRDALNLVLATPLRQQQQFIIGDGRFEGRAAKVIFHAPGPAVYFEDDPSDPVGADAAGLLFTLPSAFSSIAPYLGRIRSEDDGDGDPDNEDERLQNITNAISSAFALNIQNAVIDTLTLTMYVSYAQYDPFLLRPRPAYELPYALFNMQLLLP